MFVLNFPEVLLAKGDCMSREVLSRASAAPLIRISVATTAMEENNILQAYCPSISCSLFFCFPYSEAKLFV